MHPEPFQSLALEADADWPAPALPRSLRRPLPLSIAAINNDQHMLMYLDHHIGRSSCIHSPIHGVLPNRPSSNLRSKIHSTRVKEWRVSCFNMTLLSGSDLGIYGRSLRPQAVSRWDAVVSVPAFWGTYPRSELLPCSGYTMGPVNADPLQMIWSLCMFGCKSNKSTDQAS